VPAHDRAARWGLSRESSRDGREAAQSFAQDGEEVWRFVHFFNRDVGVVLPTGADFVFEFLVDRWILEKQESDAAEESSSRLAACGDEKLAVGVDLILRHTQALVTIVLQDMRHEVRAVGVLFHTLLRSSTDPLAVFHPFGQSAGIHESEQKAKFYPGQIS
jgi:hypothetical protein